jgi:antitoxin VapB
VDPVSHQTAKVFWSGRSQAVRLPRAYRLNSTEVRIRRHGTALILEPVATDWSWLDGLPGAFGNDAAAAALEPVQPQQRQALDSAFER